MPTFNNVEIEIIQNIDVDFEVYCNTCGKGLCSESYTKVDNNNGRLKLFVNACPYCIEEINMEIKKLLQEKNEEIEILQTEIDKLQNEIYELRQQIKQP